MTQRFLVFLLFSVLLFVGCSSKSTTETNVAQVKPNVPQSANSQDSLAPPSLAVDDTPKELDRSTKALDNLDPGNWSFSKWSTKDVDNTLHERDADFVRVNDGLQATTYGRIGKYRATFRRELLDEFEITAKVIQPSEAELRQDGLLYPSPFYVKAGFRDSNGFQGSELTLWVDRNKRETTDIRIRASNGKLSLSDGRRDPTIVSRAKVEPGYFYFELHQDRRLIISSFEVKQGLASDVALLAAVPKAESQLAGNPRNAFRRGSRTRATAAGRARWQVGAAITRCDYLSTHRRT